MVTSTPFYGSEIFHAFYCSGFPIQTKATINHMNVFVRTGTQPPLIRVGAVCCDQASAGPHHTGHTYIHRIHALCNSKQGDILNLSDVHYLFPQTLSIVGQTSTQLERHASCITSTTLYKSRTHHHRCSLLTLDHRTVVTCFLSMFLYPSV